MKERLGVFGGSFDPVHLGHLVMASEAVTRLRLDRLLFVPSRRPVHKRAGTAADVEHRLAMLRHAVRGHPAFRVSRLEADGTGPCFTVRTLETLHRLGAREIYFLMGQDSLEEFDQWHEPDRIVELAKLAVVPRGEETPSALPRPLRRRVVYVRSPRIGISSTEIRRRLRRGLPVRYWIPEAVLRYVTRHGLYGSRRRRG